MFILIVTFDRRTVLKKRMMKQTYSDLICLATCAISIQLQIVDTFLVNGCDCDYHPNGCTISEKADAGFACRCKYQGAFTCAGVETHCKDTNNKYCQNPDRSFPSCLQGEGDCLGYACDCDYHAGGCTISASAGPDSACKCTYKGAFTCGGTVVQCLHSEAQACTNPDNSLAACQQGGGDCGGY